MASMIDAHPQEDAHELVELWTRKEALAKALGTGLPDDVRTLRVPDRHVAVGRWLRAEGWLWIGCPCPEGCAAALVARSDRHDDEGTADIERVPIDEAGVCAWSIAAPI